jgi:hypothetical protein
MDTRHGRRWNKHGAHDDQEEERYSKDSKNRGVFVGNKGRHALETVVTVTR